MNVVANIFHDACRSVIQLVECENFRHLNISTIQLEAGDLVVVIYKLSEIADDQKTSRLNRVGDSPGAVAEFVFHVLPKTITSKLERRLLRLCDRSRYLVGNPPAAWAITGLMQ